MRKPTELLLRVEGTVQGVGFRPFVYRLARLLRVRGWVLNDSQGVLIRASAPAGTLAGFEAAISAEAPPAAHVERIVHLDVRNHPDIADLSNDFLILESQHQDQVDAAMPPDLAVCADCLNEMGDPADRRYRYPFINCTNCGPRYSIIEKIPYDRPDTTMRRFEFCPSCQAEYEDPADRRFHAQPIACPACGPKLGFRSAAGNPVATGDDALQAAMGDIRSGKIVAVKGIGGFHLICEAANEAAVKELRQRKRREEKPFALMVPNLEAARRLCVLSAEEEKVLDSPAAPIVLAERISWNREGVCDAVAPGNALLGIMLPSAPLHHLMFQEVNGPLVATSGNISDEPICIDENEAVERLRGIADSFLVHDRPIARPVDDSIVRFMMNGPVVLRRARGYAPTPIVQKCRLSSVLAVGAHLKNTVAVTVGSKIFSSQHLGDLSTSAACAAFDNAIHMLGQLYPVHPDAIVCDLHPDYHSTLWARRQELPVIRVQHHHAHVLSCMAEHHLDGPVLGVAWDGTGYGTDNTIWGGEWLVAPDEGVEFTRAAHLRQFRLPGGEVAIRRPALAALGMLWEVFGDEAFYLPGVSERLELLEKERSVFKRMLSNNLNTPVTSSAGRLFDAVAALIGLGGRVAFEAQAAMKLEFAAMNCGDDGCYDFRLRDCLKGANRPSAPNGILPAAAVGDCSGLPSGSVPVVVDWEPLLRDILNDLERSTEVSVIARRFHNTLAEIIGAVAREMPNLPVVLTGGCFQNKLLSESAVRQLWENGFDVYWHRRIPPNDGGVSVGQALAGSWKAEVGRQRSEVSKSKIRSPKSKI